MSATIIPPPSEEHPPAPLDIFLELRHRLGIFFALALGGLLVGLIIYLFTPTVYQARGTFLVDTLPFGSSNNNPVDAETERQLVQSLILSIPGQEIRKAVAADLGVPDKDLAFSGHDRPVSLGGGDKPRANIAVTATRNSRLGLVTAESTDPEFAAKVVQAVFDKIQNINKIAGRLAQIGRRLKLDQTEADNLSQALVTALADRIKIEQQNLALDQFVATKAPLEGFPPFAQDDALNNLKTQLMLVTSEYDAISAQASLGSKLQGKRAELDGLRTQLSRHLSELVGALHSSQQIARTREEGLRANLATIQRQAADLETLQAQTAKGLGDFKIREDLMSQNNIDLSDEEASVIVVVDPPYTVPRPVRPVFALDVGLGLIFGAALGLGSILLLLQLRPPGVPRH
jgi:uncharacterized protein involved in exopolysaccharide biosynthesis